MVFFKVEIFLFWIEEFRFDNFKLENALYKDNNDNKFSNFFYLWREYSIRNLSGVE